MTAIVNKPQYSGSPHSQTQDRTISPWVHASMVWLSYMKCACRKSMDACRVLAMASPCRPAVWALENCLDTGLDSGWNIVENLKTVDPSSLAHGTVHSRTRDMSLRLTGQAHHEWMSCLLRCNDWFLPWNSKVCRQFQAWTHNAGREVTASYTVIANLEALNWT